MKLRSHLVVASLLPSALAGPARPPSAENVVRVADADLARRDGGRPPSWDGKYFHEPGGGDDLGHYDVRYYTGAPVTYAQRGDTLYHLIRSYLSVFRERNIETWIAHGTLLGWWWNGKIMPWDWDLDTQVSGATLAWLGAHLNMTLHNYTAADPDDGRPVVRQYLLDVNPFAAERVRGDGQNVIDARWIDVRNGLFIDVTGLSETNPSAQPGVWSCKNYHRYRTADLYPLRQTEFEGVPALVPYSFDRILKEEYSARVLTKTKHEGHLWVPEQKEWIREETLRPNPAVHGRPRPHVPRSLQAEDEPKAGLRNLLRIL
ncbi:hypothetical protein JHW43_000700 [Diplocarpon mali]|nr:hypothetical protein JHW43_000700 [Diplocarpon mali]